MSIDKTDRFIITGFSENKQNKKRSIHLKQPSLIAVVAIGHIHGNQEGRCGHKDQLETPEANVGHWEELIIADVLARVAGEIGLLVSPDALRSYDQHHDSENEQHREPDLPQGGGVTVGADQLSVQSRPRHPVRNRVYRKTGKIRHNYIQVISTHSG
uniref:Uncharacterized protein n=1 Tax=Fundulus heteroclitus TaxID=8078 RepID=A0A3Q2PIV7_FUNHE